MKRFGVSIQAVAVMILVLGGAVQALTAGFSAAHSGVLRSAMKDLRAIGTAVESYMVDNGFPLAVHGVGIEAASHLREYLEPTFIKHLPERNAWGNSYWWWSAGSDSYSIVSLGKDGPAGVRLVRGVTREPGADMVFSNGEFTAYPEPDLLAPSSPVASDASALRETMSRLRSIGTAVESYQVDNGFVPRVRGKEVPVDALRADLVPTFIKRLPETDAWGTPLLWSSNGESYSIVSAGKDGAFEDAPKPGAHPEGDYDRDIVFSNGRFTVYPKTVD